MKLFFSLVFSAIVFLQTSAQTTSQKEPFNFPEADTIPDIPCRVYKVPLEAIQISDTDTQLNSGYINFNVRGLLTSLEPVELRLMLDYYFPPQKLLQPEPASPEELFAANIYKALDKNILFINGQPFSGTLRLYCNAYWYDLVHRPYPSLALVMNIYKDGVLIKSEKLGDVGSVCDDWMRVRPT